MWPADVGGLGDGDILAEAPSGTGARGLQLTVILQASSCVSIECKLLPIIPDFDQCKALLFSPLTQDYLGVQYFSKLNIIWTDMGEE